MVSEKWRCEREIKSCQGEQGCITEVLKEEIQRNGRKYLKQPVRKYNLRDLSYNSERLKIWI